MRKIFLTLALLFVLLNMMAQNKPAVKKLPTRIVMIERDIHKETGKISEEVKNEYTLTYNNANQAINIIYDYYNSSGKNTITSNYTYNEQGNPLNEIYTRESGENWYNTFEYAKHEGLDFAIVKTIYGKGESIDREEYYPLNLITGLFVDDKTPDARNYHEYEYDDNSNLLKTIYNASTMAYKKTETYTYGSAYSPYICINKLPIWNSSSLLLPEIIITGLNSPISYIASLEYDYQPENNSSEKTTYTITVDKDNYPIKIVANRDSNLSKDYLFFKEYTFFYDVIN